MKKNQQTQTEAHSFKKIFLIIVQSKGGAGKSMLTYFLALKNEKNEETLFVDLDNSTKTTTNQLKFLIDSKRVAEINLSNREDKIDRERLFTVLETLNDMEKYTEIYLDCGAPESEQIPSLFHKDFTPQEFKEFEEQLGSKIVFNVVIAGGSAYTACMSYLEKILVLKDLFEVNIFINEQTFSTTIELIDEVEKIAVKHSLGCKKFGNIYPDRQSGLEILNNAKNGVGLSGFSSFAARTQINRQLNQL